MTFTMPVLVLVFFLSMTDVVNNPDLIPSIGMFAVALHTVVVDITDITDTVAVDDG